MKSYSAGFEKVEEKDAKTLQNRDEIWAKKGDGVNASHGMASPIG